MTIDRASPLDSVSLPASPWSGGSMERLEAEGAVRRRAWRLPGSGATTLELLAPIRERLIAAGFEPVFACATEACGGFDFRLNAPVLPEPGMHVALGDFRYLLATSGEGPRRETIALLVSRAADAGYVQMIEVGPATEQAREMTGADLAVAEALGTVAPREIAGEASDMGADAAADPPLPKALDAAGRAVLEGLSFASGSAELGAGTHASLAALAAWMREHPEAQVVLVGHTDTSGGLQANLALSRARAAAALERLVAEHGADRARLAAEGVGPLAPRASNATEAGRTANRRVEAVVVSDQAR